MARHIVYEGDVDPVSLILDIIPSDVITDMTTVTSTVIRMVDRGTGAAETWAVEVMSQTTELLRVRHRFTTADTTAGRSFKGWPILTVTGFANPVAGKGSFILAVVPR